MKRRVDETTTINTARAGGTAAIHIATPQNRISSPNANQNQSYMINVLKDSQTGAMVAPTTNIQYTYTSAAIPNATSIPKNNVAQAAPSQVQIVNASVLTNSVRQKPATTGTITPTPHSVTSPGGAAAAATANAQNVSGQNFPRLKVEDALSYLDQVK